MKNGHGQLRPRDIILKFFGGLFLRAVFKSVTFVRSPTMVRNETEQGRPKKNNPIWFLQKQEPDRVHCL